MLRLFFSLPAAKIPYFISFDIDVECQERAKLRLPQSPSLAVVSSPCAKDFEKSNFLQIFSGPES